MSKSLFRGAFRNRRYPNAPGMVRDVGWFNSRTELEVAWAKFIEMGYALLGENFLHPDEIPLGKCDVGVYLPATERA